MRLAISALACGLAAAILGGVGGGLATERSATASAPCGPAKALRRVNQDELAKALEKVTSRKWRANKNWVQSVMEAEKTPQSIFLITHASCQQDQSLALAGFASWQRALAIIWSGNGWTLVSDMNAWFHYGDEATKVVSILRTTHPAPTWDDYRAFTRKAKSRPAR